MLEEFVNYYEILEISLTAESNEIEQKYKDVSRQLRNQQNNPDDNIQEEAKRKLKELPKAKKVLLDPVERQKYNQQLEEYQRRQQQARSQDSQGNDIASSSELIKEGYRLFGIGAINAALAVAKKATARYGDDPNTWALLAEAKLRTHDIQSAIYEYKRAIELNPKETKFHYSLGQVYEKAGRNQDAIYEYKRTIELNPKEAKFHHSLGQVYEKAGRNQDALAEYKNAIVCDSKEVFYHLSLGSLYGNKLDDWESSINILEQCYADNPNYSLVAEHLALAYDGFIKKYGSYKTKDDIKTSLQILDRADNLAIKFRLDSMGIIQETKRTYCSHLRRKFNGNYFLGALGSLVWGSTLMGIINYQQFFYLGFILCFVLYYLSCRPPRYADTDGKKTFSQAKMGCIGWVLFASIFPLLVPFNFMLNYLGKNNPSSDEYLREVIKKM